MTAIYFVAVMLIKLTLLKLTGPGSKGILLEGANIPTLPILSPFVSTEHPSNFIQKDE